METQKVKEISGEITEKNINRDEMTITHFITTKTPDRYGEIVEPLGCDEKEYRKNPVVFFGHRSRDLPIAKNVRLIYEENGIIAVTKFDESEYAKDIFRMNAEGYLNSWSIGFVPIEPPKLKEKYLVFEKWKLLEYSSVPIPANPDAVNLMLKEIKNERVREIFEQEERMRKYYEDEFLKKMETNKKETEEMVEEKIRQFEHKLVSKLLQTNKNKLNEK